MIEATPGPWEYGFPKKDGVEMRECDCQVSAGGFLIASVSHGGIYPEESFGSAQREANARLIAAAPDLLAALKLLMSDIYQGANPSDKECQRITGSWGKARAAIAKATELPKR